MLKERVEELENAIHEIEGRALMHDILIAHLLGRAGMASGNMEGFINGVLIQVGNDLQETALRSVDKDSAPRYVFALEAFKSFAQSLQHSLRERPKGDLN